MPRSAVVFRLIAVALFLFLRDPAWAQEQGGGIQGVVRDASKAVLPGATVEARSPSMPGVATAVSDGQGIYRFPVLRPGVYELTATLPGFASVRVPDVLVRLGAEFRIDIGMEVARLAESVQVTAESPVIDVRQNAATSTISDEALKLLPARGRNFTDVLTNAPGVQSVDSGVSVDGASGLENHYIVDGMKTTAILTGSSARRFCSSTRSAIPATDSAGTRWAATGCPTGANTRSSRGRRANTMPWSCALRPGSATRSS